MSSTSDAFSLGSAENHPFKVPIVYWDQPPVHVPQSMCTTSSGVITGGGTGEMVVWKWVKSEEPRPPGISKNNQLIPHLFLTGDAVASVTALTSFVTHRGTLVAAAEPSPHISLSSPSETVAALHADGTLSLWTATGSTCRGTTKTPLRHASHLYVFYPTSYYFGAPGARAEVTVNAQSQLISVGGVGTGLVSSLALESPVLVLAGVGPVVLLVDSLSGRTLASLPLHAAVRDVALSCVPLSPAAQDADADTTPSGPSGLGLGLGTAVSGLGLGLRTSAPPALALPHPLCAAPAMNDEATPEDAVFFAAEAEAPEHVRLRGRYLMVLCADGSVTCWDLDEVLAAAAVADRDAQAQAQQGMGVESPFVHVSPPRPSPAQRPAALSLAPPVTPGGSTAIPAHTPPLCRVLVLPPDPDLSYLAAGSGSGVPAASAASEDSVLSDDWLGDEPLSLAVSADGSLLCVTYARTLMVVEARSLRIVATTTAAQLHCWSVAARASACAQAHVGEDAGADADAWLPVPVTLPDSKATDTDPEVPTASADAALPPSALEALAPAEGSVPLLSGGRVVLGGAAVVVEQGGRAWLLALAAAGVGGAKLVPYAVFSAAAGSAASAGAGSALESVFAEAAAGAPVVPDVAPAMLSSFSDDGLLAAAPSHPTTLAFFPLPPPPLSLPSLASSLTHVVPAPTPPTPTAHAHLCGGLLCLSPSATASLSLAFRTHAPVPIVEAALVACILTDLATSTLLLFQGYRSGRMVVTNLLVGAPPAVFYHPYFPPGADTVDAPLEDAQCGPGDAPQDELYVRTQNRHRPRLSRPYPVSVVPLSSADSPLGVCAVLVLFNDSSLAVYNLNPTFRTQHSPLVLHSSLSTPTPTPTGGKVTAQDAADADLLATWHWNSSVSPALSSSFSPLHPSQPLAQLMQLLSHSSPLTSLLSDDKRPRSDPAFFAEPPATVASLLQPHTAQLGALQASMVTLHLFLRPPSPFAAITGLHFIPATYTSFSSRVPLVSRDAQAQWLLSSGAVELAAHHKQATALAAASTRVESDVQAHGKNKDKDKDREAASARARTLTDLFVFGAGGGSRSDTGSSPIGDLFFLTRSDNTVQVASLLDRDAARTLPAHDSPVRFIIRNSFCVEQNVLITITAAGAVYLWSLRDAALLRVLYTSIHGGAAAVNPYSHLPLYHAVAPADLAGPLHYLAEYSPAVHQFLAKAGATQPMLPGYAAGAGMGMGARVATGLTSDSSGPLSRSASAFTSAYPSPALSSHSARAPLASPLPPSHLPLSPPVSHTRGGLPSLLSPQAHALFSTGIAATNARTPAPAPSAHAPLQVAAAAPLPHSSSYSSALALASPSLAMAAPPATAAPVASAEPAQPPLCPCCVLRARAHLAAHPVTLPPRLPLRAPPSSVDGVYVCKADAAPLYVASAAPLQVAHAHAVLAAADVAADTTTRQLFAAEKRRLASAAQRTEALVSALIDATLAVADASAGKGKGSGMSSAVASITYGHARTDAYALHAQAARGRVDEHYTPLLTEHQRDAARGALDTVLLEGPCGADCPDCGLLVRGTPGRACTLVRGRMRLSAVAGARITRHKGRAATSHLAAPPPRPRPYSLSRVAAAMRPATVDPHAHAPAVADSVTALAASNAISLCDACTRAACRAALAPSAPGVPDDALLLSFVSSSASTATHARRHSQSHTDPVSCNDGTHRLLLPRAPQPPVAVAVPRGLYQGQCAVALGDSSFPAVALATVWPHQLVRDLIDVSSSFAFADLLQYRAHVALVANHSFLLLANLARKHGVDLPAAVDAYSHERALPAAQQRALEALFADPVLPRTLANVAAAAAGQPQPFTSSALLVPACPVPSVPYAVEAALGALSLLLDWHGGGLASAAHATLQRYLSPPATTDTANGSDAGHSGRGRGSGSASSPVCVCACSTSVSAVAYAALPIVPPPTAATQTPLSLPPSSACPAHAATPSYTLADALLTGMLPLAVAPSALLSPTPAPTALDRYQHAHAPVTPLPYTPHATLLPALALAQDMLAADPDALEPASPIAASPSSPASPSALTSAFTSALTHSLLPVGPVSFPLPSHTYRAALDHLLPGVAPLLASHACFSDHGRALSVLFPVHNVGQHCVSTPAQQHTHSIASPLTPVPDTPVPVSPVADTAPAAPGGPPTPSPACAALTHAYAGHGRWRVDSLFTSSAAVHVQTTAMALLNTDAPISQHFSPLVAYVHAVLPAATPSSPQIIWSTSHLAPTPALALALSRALHPAPPRALSPPLPQGRGYVNPDIWRVCPLLLSPSHSHYAIAKTLAHSLVHRLDHTQARDLHAAAVHVFATALVAAGASAISHAQAVPTGAGGQHSPRPQHPDADDAYASALSPPSPRLLTHTLPPVPSLPLAPFPAPTSIPALPPPAAVSGSVPAQTGPSSTPPLPFFLPSPAYSAQLAAHTATLTVGPAPLSLLSFALPTPGIPSSASAAPPRPGREFSSSLLASLFLLASLEVTAATRKAPPPPVAPVAMSSRRMSVATPPNASLFQRMPSAANAPRTPLLAGASPSLSAHLTRGSRTISVSDAMLDTDTGRATWTAGLADDEDELAVLTLAPTREDARSAAPVATLGLVPPSLRARAASPAVSAVADLLGQASPFHTEVRRQLLAHVMLAALTYSLSFWDVGCTSPTVAAQLLTHLAVEKTRAHVTVSYTHTPASDAPPSPPNPRSPRASDEPSAAPAPPPTLLTAVVPLSLSPAAVACLTLVLDAFAKGLVLWLPYITDILDLAAKLHYLSLCAHYPALATAAQRALLQLGRVAPKPLISALAKEAVAPAPSSSHPTPTVASLHAAIAAHALHALAYADSGMPVLRRQRIPILVAAPDTTGSAFATSPGSALLSLATVCRKHPQSTYGHVPLLVQLLVRCLDPVRPNLRRALLQSATSVLHALVSAFPTVAFDQQAQRIAVVTTALDLASPVAMQRYWSGAPMSADDCTITIYDLRTATRLKVLSGHTAPVLALAFSPSGTTLLSYTRTEVRFWAVGGASLLSSLLGGTGRCTQTSQLAPCPVNAPSALLSVAVQWEASRGKQHPEKATVVREDGSVCKFA